MWTISINGQTWLAFIGGLQIFKTFQKTLGINLRLVGENLGREDWSFQHDNA